MNIESQLARYERIIKAAMAMNDHEKAALTTWEQENLAGDGTLATSDWPGWDAIINRISH
jgi:hypothetical protein